MDRRDVTSSNLTEESVRKTTIHELNLLSINVEKKRAVLNELYDEIKSNQDFNQPNIKPSTGTISDSTKASNFSKHVHFENKISENANPNTTKRLDYLKGLNSNKDTTEKPPVKISTINAGSKSPTKKPISLNANKIVIQAINSGKSDAKPRKPVSQPVPNPNTAVIPYKPNTKVYLTFQQRKKLELEQKEEFKAKLDDIKSRVILRKFAYIWLRRVCYSRLTLENKRFLLPSQAISYYEKRTLGVLFAKWRKDCRLERNEWRATVKAECHFNYILLNKYWKLLRIYTIEHKTKTSAENLATYHYNNKIKTKYIQEWRLIHLQTKRHRINLNKIQADKNVDLLKEYFQLWIIKFINEKKKSKLTEIADRQYQIFHLSRYYAIWNFKLNNEKEERRKFRLADTFYKQRILKKCMHSLKIYTIYRRKKGIQKQKLREYADSQLVFRFYKLWMIKYEEKKEIKETELVIDQFKNRFLKLRAFEYLLTEFRRRIKSRQMEIQMNRFYQKNLKRKFFNILLNNHYDEKIKMLDHETAIQAELKFMKIRYYSKWIDKYEEKTDIRQLHLSYKAKVHYEKSLIKKSMKTWMIYLIDSREVNNKYQKADDHHKRCLFRRYLDSIKAYVELTKAKRENHQKASEFYKERSLYNYFMTWYQKYEMAIELQMNMRIAILHEESKVKNHVFNTWYTKYINKLIEEVNENKSEIFYKRKLLKTSLKIWLNHVDETKTEIKNEDLAIRHDFKRTCRSFFNEWKSYIESNRIEQSKCDAADNYYRKNLFRKLFSVWKIQTKEFKRINLLVDAMYRIKENERLLDLFTNWFYHTKLDKMERKNEELAYTLYARNLSKKVFDNWYICVRNKKDRDRADDLAIENFNKKISKLILTEKFLIWKQRTEEIINENSKDNLADCYCRRKLFSKVLIGWRLYITKCRNYKLLEHQAQIFFQVRLKTEFYFKWIKKYETELDMRDKNEQALILWAINIKRKCYSAWFDWFKYKKEKKNRYKLVLHDRQIDILKDCARKMLIYSMDSKQRRINSNDLLKKRRLLDTLDLEIKYFNLWLSKCKFYKQKKTVQINPVVEQNDFKYTIRKDSSLKQKEVFSESTLIVKDISFSSNRPKPKKPTFLIDSIDLSNKSKKIENLVIPSENLYEPIISPKPIVSSIQAELSNLNLLPPTAFTISSSKVQFIGQQNLHENNSKRIEINLVKDNDEISVSTIGKEEIQSELDLKRKEKRNDSKTVPREMSVGKHTKTSKKQNGNSELEDLKKRLEILTIKSEKLKRLKEQERLLNSCINSNETLKTNMCETIYQERDQVQKEIEDISKFVKSEKLLVNELLKNITFLPNNS